MTPPAKMRDIDYPLDVGIRRQAMAIVASMESVLKESSGIEGDLKLLVKQIDIVTMKIIDHATESQEREPIGFHPETACNQMNISRAIKVNGHGNELGLYCPAGFMDRSCQRMSRLDRSNKQIGLNKAFHESQGTTCCKQQIGAFNGSDNGTTLCICQLVPHETTSCYCREPSARGGGKHDSNMNEMPHSQISKPRFTTKQCLPATICSAVSCKDEIRAEYDGKGNTSTRIAQKRTMFLDLKTESPWVKFLESPETDDIFPSPDDGPKLSALDISRLVSQTIQNLEYSGVYEKELENKLESDLDSFDDTDSFSSDSSFSYLSERGTESVSTDSLLRTYDPEVNTWTTYTMVHMDNDLPEYSRDNDSLNVNRSSLTAGTGSFDEEDLANDNTIMVGSWDNFTF